MCCCFVTQCCCGCTNLKVGVIIWAIIDAIINLSLTIFALTAAGAKYTNWWGVLVLVVDFILAIGAHTSNTGLILVWQVVMMINIVILFIMWMVVPIHGVKAVADTGIGTGVIVTIIGIILVLPVAYLYWWIVVYSLRSRIMEMEMQILPVQQPVVLVPATQQLPPGYTTYPEPSAASGFENKY